MNLQPWHIKNYVELQIEHIKNRAKREKRELTQTDRCKIIQYNKIRQFIVEHPGYQGELI